MSKLVGIKTYERFRRLWENNDINEFSLNFILDTGQLYTHGIFINSAVFGTAANGAVSLSIAGTTNTLALSSHIHSNYYDKSEDLDVTNHKIVSGNNALLFCSGGTLYLGNTDNPTYISGSTLYSTRGQNSYTILDTGNFEITNRLPSGYTFLNTALIKYGGQSHQIDYVKRINTSQSFDYLHSYTQAGTNLLNGVYYGYINFTVDNIYNNPAWAQLRINITGKTIQYRTSADANNWIDLNSTNISLNSLNVAGIVPAPTVTNPNKVWKTDNEGNPAWRDEKTYIFQDLTFQQIPGTNLTTYDTTVARTILAGDNIAFSYENGIITLRALNTTYSDFVGASQSENGVAGLVVQPLAGDQNKYLRGDGSWLNITSDLTASLMVGASNGTSTEAQSTNGDVHFIFKLGNSYKRYQIVGTGRASVTSDSNGNITINSNPYSNFSAATDTATGTAGLVPAPGINELGNTGYFLRADGTWLKPTDNNTWRSIYVDGILKLDVATDTKPINFKAAGGITLTFTGAGNNPTNTLEIKSIAYNNFTAATTQKAGESGLVPGPAINQFGSDGYYLRADGTWNIPTNTWNEANTNQAGYIPQLVTGGPAISGQTTEYVLTYVSTETGVVTPKWKILPVNAFKDTWEAASFTLAGYVPLSIKGKYLHANIDDGSLEWIDDRDTTYNTFTGASTTDDGTSGLVIAPTAGELSKFLKGNGTWDTPTNTWRNIYVSGIQQMTTSKSSKGLNLVAGDNISLVYAAPGTSANQSGSNAYGNLTITAIDTWIAWQGASSQSNGTAGYMPAPTTAQKNLFLRGDGQWVSLNNYSLPVATNSTLGGVKVGTTLDSDTGFTKVHIKDSYIYYHDTTYSFSNLKFLQTSGTDLMTYNSQAVRTILAGTGITFSHSNNILTISSATYSTATASSLGLVKIGTILEDTTGYTKVHIDENGFIYYHDTTYSFSKLKFQQISGTDLMTYDSLAARTIVAGDNITFTHSNNVLTIKAIDTTYNTVSKTAAGLCPTLPNETTTTKYLRLDGAWITPPNDNTWKAANSSQEGYVPKSTANKILRTNDDGILYWGDDANTTYTFYNLQFQDLGGTIVDTYKPATSPTKTLKAGNNVTISAASNVITIASTNTWNANAVGVAGYVAAPDATNDKNKFWKTDENGNPTWTTVSIASAEHTHSVKINGSTKTITALGGATVDLGNYAIAQELTNEDLNGIKTPGFYNGGGSNSSDNKPSGTTSFGLEVIHTALGSYYELILYKSAVDAPYRRYCNNGTWSNWVLDKYTDNNTTYKLTLNGTTNGDSTNGTSLGTLYAIPTSNATVKDQVWMRNSDNTGYAWRTLGSNAFNSTNYLPLTGGILTNTERLLLTLHQNTDGAGPYIAFRLNGSDVGYFGYNVLSGFFMQSVTANKTLRIYTDGTLQFGGNQVLDISNTYVNTNGVGYINNNPITKLSDTTTRKFWNQTYWLDGKPASADITGDLTGSGNINMLRGNGIRFKTGTSTDANAYVMALRCFVNSEVLSLGYETTAGQNNSTVGADGKGYATNIYGKTVSLFSNTSSGIAEGLILATTGNVGIGNSIPNYKLDVNGTGRFSGDLLMESGRYIKFKINNDYTSALGVWGTGYNLLQLGYYTTSEKSYATSIYGNILRLYGSATILGMLIDTNGNVGIGMASPSTKLDVNGSLRANYYKASWSASGTAGSSGYVNIADITVTGSYANTPLKFRVVQRGQTNGGEITVRFTNVDGAANARIAQFFCYGDIPTVFITQSGTVFSLYIEKAEPWDTICITGIDLGSSKLSVEWKNGFATSIPSGAVIAEHFFLIGNNRIIYDSASSALKVVHKNGSSTANFYASNFYTTSDRNKKLNITVFSEHIRKFQLKGTEKYAYGVIAQEVEEMFRSGKEGEMNVNYNSILSFYVGQLENRVKELEEKIRLLETK